MCLRLELKGKCSWYWSSSDASDAISAWGVSFNGGDVGGDSEAYYGYVRCVRD